MNVLACVSTWICGLLLWVRAQGWRLKQQTRVNDLFLILPSYLFILREIKRECTCAGEGQKERGRQRTPSRLCPVSADPDVGLDPTNHEIVT